MVKTCVNDCHILGTSLLYLNELKKDRLDQIKNNLTSIGIDTELTDSSIANTILEWHDFFEFTEDDSITLTKNASQNKLLVEMIFYKVLSEDIRKEVLNSVFNCPKPKIIMFPKK